MTKKDKSKKGGADKDRKTRAGDKVTGAKAPRAKKAAAQRETGAQAGARKTKAVAKPGTPAASSRARGATASRKPGSAPGRARDDVRQQVIAELAYFLAEQRRVAKPDAVDDWLQAEKAVDRLLESLA